MTILPPSSLNEKLNEANQIILGEISRTNGSITLGLLPLSQEVEHNCIELVIQSANGALSKLIQMLERVAPAVTCYAIASSASQAVKEGKNFWKPVSEKLGINLSSPIDRQKLADLYSKTCQRLGVIVPNVSTMSWTHIAPMMAQASILHAWSSNLADGLKRTLKATPAPDTTDQHAVHQFSQRLTNNITGANNLKSVLSTEVGSMVTERAVSSFVNNDYSSLPFHLVAPLKEAFSSSASAVHLKSPYLSFSEAYAELEVVLPKQLTKLVNEMSFWQIGNRQYSPTQENKISSSELSSGLVSIRLRNLSQGFEDQVFEVDLRMPNGFLVFDQINGRLRTTKTGETNTLTPGEYLLVMKNEVTTNDEDYVENVGSFRLLKDIYLRPGSGSIEVYAEQATTILTSALMTGIYLPKDSSNSIFLNDGSSLHYGEDLHINAFVPKVQNDGSFLVEISVDGEKILSKPITLESFESGVFDYSDILSAAAQDTCENLSPGIYKIQFKIATNSASATKEIWFWKGLNYISETNGFICDEAPENIDFHGSKGIKKEGLNCAFVSNFRAPEVTVHLKKSGETLHIPRPGIQATLLSPEEQWTEELTANTCLPLSNSDRRLVTIKSGGFHDWQLLCNQVKLSTLTRDRPQRTFSLSSLAAEFGDSGTITAENQEGQKLSILSYASDLIATDLRRLPDHGKNQDVWKCRIPLEKIGKLAIKITDYTNSPVDPSPSIIELPVTQLNENNQLIEATISPVLDTTLKWKPSSNKFGEAVSFSLVVNNSSLSHEFQFLEIIHQPEDTEQWVPLQCNEKVNTSQLCLLLSGPAPIADDCTWWKHLCRVSSSKDGALDSSLYHNISPDELKQGIKTISKIVSTKFPTQAFLYNAKYFVSLDHRLAERRKAAGFLDNNVWWNQHVRELDDQCQGANKLATRAFVISSHEAVLDSAFEIESQMVADNASAKSLNFKQEVIQAGGHLTYVTKYFHTQEHLHALYQSFNNFSLVSSGKEQLFKEFNFSTFFKTVYQKALDHDLSASDLSEAPPLSARQLLNATKQLKRRARVMESVVNAEADHILSSRVSRISELHRDITSNAKQIYSGIRFTPLQKHDPTRDSTINQYFPDWPGLLETKPDHQHKATQIADLCWGLACLTRSKAHGTIDQQQYDKLIQLFRGKDAMTSPLNLIFTYAPELFVFHTSLLAFAHSN